MDKFRIEVTYKVGDAINIRTYNSKTISDAVMIMRREAGKPHTRTVTLLFVAEQWVKTSDGKLTAIG